MTAAAFERAVHRGSSDRGLLDEAKRQQTISLVLISVAVLILIVGYIASSLIVATAVAALYVVGTLSLIGQRRATVIHAVVAGALHLGAVLLLV